MPRDPRVDAYIARSAEFARPILSHLREVLHSIDPEIGESIKWGMPAFLWRDKQLANMAAFKQHASFGFWNREKSGEKPGEQAEAGEGMGQYGRITKLSELPSDDELLAAARQGMERIDAGAKAPRSQSQPKIPLAMPADFAEVLEQAGARTSFDGFPPGARRDYLEWILDAKQPATRSRRMAQAAEWIGEGRHRNWKYQR